MSLIDGEVLHGFDCRLFVSHADYFLCDYYLSPNDEQNSTEISMTSTLSIHSSLLPSDIPNAPDDPSDISSEHPSVILMSNSSESTPRPPRLRVTIHEVPADANILCFTFLRTFGTVMEARILSSIGVYSTGDDLGIIPDLNRVLFFTILPFTDISAENLLSFNSANGYWLVYHFIVRYYSFSPHSLLVDHCGQALINLGSISQSTI